VWQKRYVLRFHFCGNFEGVLKGVLTFRVYVSRLERTAKKRTERTPKNGTGNYTHTSASE
jgi:hypothetical protein